MLQDLIFVLRQIKKTFEEFGLLDLYNSYANAIQQISQASTPELQQAVKDYKSRIMQAHSQLDPKGWSQSQLHLFEKFGASKIIGENGWRNFLDALANNQANAPGAVEQLNALNAELTKLITDTDNILKSMGGLAEEVETKEHEAVIQIVFEDKVSVDNLIELVERSKEWKDVIRAFSLLAKTAPEETRIIAVSKSSPFMVWLGTVPVIAKAIESVIKAFLEIWKEVLVMRQSALILEEKKLTIAGKRLELFKEIDEWARGRVVKTVEQVAEINKAKGLNDAMLNEAKAALLSAGPNLYAFLTGGGKVDASQSRQNEKGFKEFQFTPQYQEIRKIDENVQKLLEAKKIKTYEIKKPKVKKPKKTKRSKP